MPAGSGSGPGRATRQRNDAFFNLRASRENMSSSCSSDGEVDDAMVPDGEDDDVEEEEEEQESVSPADFEVSEATAQREDDEAGSDEPSDGISLGSPRGTGKRALERYLPRTTQNRQRAREEQEAHKRDRAMLLDAKRHIYALASARQPDKPWTAKHVAAVEALGELATDIDVGAPPRPPKELKRDADGLLVPSDHALLQQLWPHVAVLATRSDPAQPPASLEIDAINALLAIARKIAQ